MPEQRLLTVRETCRELSVSRPTLAEMRRAGLIRTVRIGSRGVRVAASEIERFIASESGGDCDNLGPPKKRKPGPLIGSGSG